MAERIGFIGIGNMGFPMAANLAKAGFPLSVYDTNAEACARFAQAHPEAHVATDPGDLGGRSDVVITMLPTGAIVGDVVLGPGLLKSLAKGSVVIDMSSSEPVGTQELGKALKEHGIPLVDAPVSGGVPRAETGQLAIMIGGDDPYTIERVQPILAAMGDKLFLTGALGTGHAMKALNNFVAAAGFMASSEALLVGQRFGLDPAVALDVLNASSGRNFNTENAIKHHVLTGTFATGFALGLMAKDVRIAADLAESVGFDGPMARLVREHWAAARDAVGAEQDFSAAYKVWEGK